MNDFAPGRGPKIIKNHKIFMKNSIPSQRNTGCALSRIQGNSMVATPLLAILDNSAKYLRILTSTMMKKVKNFMKFQENVDWRPLNSPAGLPRNHKKSHGELQKYSASSKPL